MPVYEFVCNACQKTFTKTLTIAEHENEKIVCPDCGSENVEHTGLPSTSSHRAKPLNSVLRR